MCPDPTFTTRFPAMMNLFDFLQERELERMDVDRFDHSSLDTSTPGHHRGAKGEDDSETFRRER